MMKMLRRRSLALAALLFLLGMVSAELCLHGGHVDSPPFRGATVALACADCTDCDGSAGEAEHGGHACLCACHTVGVIAGLGAPVDAAHPGAIVPLADGALPAGHRSPLERPPLTTA
jgi:hypothetical protein